METNDRRDTTERDGHSFGVCTPATSLAPQSHDSIGSSDVNASRSASAMNRTPRDHAAPGAQRIVENEPQRAASEQNENGFTQVEKPCDFCGGTALVVAAHVDACLTSQWFDGRTMPACGDVCPRANCPGCHPAAALTGLFAS